jgi:hypothetical protein
LVVVPSDVLRNQIADKFVTLGLLKKPGIGLLAPTAQFPIVCKLEHIPQDLAELDALAERSQVIVTTSSIVGQCSEELQNRFAHHCPYLFIERTMQKRLHGARSRRAFLSAGLSSSPRRRSGRTDAHWTGPWCSSIR